MLLKCNINVLVSSSHTILICVHSPQRFFGSFEFSELWDSFDIAIAMGWVKLLLLTAFFCNVQALNLKYDYTSGELQSFIAGTVGLYSYVLKNILNIFFWLAIIYALWCKNEILGLIQISCYNCIIVVNLHALYIH